MEQSGIEDVWKIIEEFVLQQRTKGYFEQNRQQQAVDWFRENLGQALLERFYKQPEIKAEITRTEAAVRENRSEPNLAVQELLQKYWPKQ